jgi:hypothetical protein
MKDKMNELSRLLLALHKTLLHFEKDLHEKRMGRSFTPHELLHLSLNDEKFAWLRKISDLIVALDTRIDEKDKPLTENDFAFYAGETSQLFFVDSDDATFKGKLMEAVTVNSEAMIQLAGLRNFLKQNPIRTN